MFPIVVLFSIVACGHAQFGSGCGPNQEYTTCMPTNPEECATAASCQAGCKCSPGFYRNVNGACVAAAQCPAAIKPATCAQNEVFQRCGQKDEVWCSPRGGALFTGDLPGKGCSEGCFCRPGYVRLYCPNDPCVFKPNYACPRGKFSAMKVCLH